jgi:hypothetical protein
MLHASKHGKSDYLIGLHDYGTRHDTVYDEIKSIAKYVDGFNAPGLEVERDQHDGMTASSRSEVASKHSLNGMRETDTHFGATAGWLNTPPLLFVFRRDEGVSDEQIQEMYDKYAYNINR